MKKIPLLLDKPVKELEQDQFGHEHYADLLFDLITNEQITPPYNIGLLGKWGVGKSSIKEMCKKRLEEEKDNIFCIDFNAWKYGGDGIKTALLRHIYFKLGGKDEKIKDEFSRQITKQVLELNKNNELLKSVWNVIGNWAQSIGLLILIFFGYKKILPHLGETGGAIATIPFAYMAVAIIKEILNKNNMLIPIFQNITKVDMPSTTPEVYEEFLKNQIPEFKEINEYKKVNKIVVFVDDLDRLPSANEMIEGINAIRAFMDIEVTENIGFIFVLSCCEYKIADALLSININNDDTDDETYQFDKKIEAKRFLDKIFHFRVDIPPFPYRDMIEYSKIILKSQIKDFDDFEKELKSSGTDIDNLLCRLIHPKVQEPRQAIQIMNAFFQTWNIAIKRENMAGEKAGGLKKGIVTKHPLTLATLAVLKVDFPYFYKDLLKESKLLNFILETIRTNREPDFYIDEKIKNVYINYDVKNKTSYLKEAFYDLELYFNFINNKFEFPKSLKPFLLLNQDRLSRELGEQAFEIEEALIHKQTSKIVKLFNLEEHKLSAQNAKLLLDVYENCVHSLHKLNAFYTIVQLTSHLDDTSRFLIDSFADTLYGNNGYRNLLSVDDYENLLFVISPDKAKKILKSIEESFMYEHHYSVPDDQNEADEEELIAANHKKAAEIKLKYYEKNTVKIDLKFLKWITNPKYGTFYDGTPVSKDDVKPVTFGFEFTFNSFIKYSYLYDYVSYEYVAAFVQALAVNENEFFTEKNKDDIFKSIDKALINVLKNDENKFYKLIESVNNKDHLELFNYIFDFISKNSDAFSEKVLSFCFGYLTVVIENELYSPEMKVDILSILEFLQLQLQNNYAKLSDESLEGIEENIDSLIKKNLHINKIIELYNILKSNQYSNIEEIENKLITESFIDPLVLARKPVRDCIFENYPNFNDENKDYLYRVIADIAIDDGKDSLTEEELNVFHDLVNCIDPATDNIIVTNLLDRIVDFVLKYILPNEYTEYFEQLASVSKKLFKHSNSEKVSELFSEVMSNSEFASICFEIMGDEFSELDPKVWNNNNFAQNIFDVLVSDFNTIEEIQVAVNMYKKIKELEIEENIEELYNIVLALRKNIVKISELLVQLKPIKHYSVDEFISFAVDLEENEENRNSLYKIWDFLFAQYNNEEQEEITGKLLFLPDSECWFKLWINIFKNKTGKYDALINLIKKYSIDENVEQLLMKRTLITDQLLGEDRKEPSQILLLNSRIIFESKLGNREDLVRQMLQWAYDLYNDIIRDTRLIGLHEDHKKLISDIFQGKTFGKIRMKKTL